PSRSPPAAILLPSPSPSPAPSPAPTPTPSPAPVLFSIPTVSDDEEDGGLSSDGEEGFATGRARQDCESETEEGGSPGKIRAESSDEEESGL
ncbi:MAG: hypothetical protein Q8P67_19930, partial [archaeon]|nr:hypothetical protein [archaeon]